MLILLVNLVLIEVFKIEVMWAGLTTKLCFVLFSFVLYHLIEVSSILSVQLLRRMIFLQRRAIVKKVIFVCRVDDLIIARSSAATFLRTARY
jgi:hypothetical protein